MCKTKGIALAAIMCPSFCIVEEPPPLCKVEQPCDTIGSGGGAGGIPFLPIPLALLGTNIGGGGNNELLIPIPPRMPEMPPLHPVPPWAPPITPPNLPPENPPTQVVAEPGSAVVIATLAFTGFLLNRKKNGTSNP